MICSKMKQADLTYQSNQLRAGGIDEDDLMESMPTGFHDELKSDLPDLDQSAGWMEDQ